MKDSQRHLRPHSLGIIVLALFLAASLALGYGVAFAGKAHAATYTPPPSDRADTLIDSSWRFHLGDVSGAQNPSFDDASWGGVTLPHTWNAIDGQDGGSNYYRGIGWYRLHQTIPSADAGKQIFLQFDGADLVTDVYVNGTLLGEHQGGYAAFRYNATAALTIGGDNVIAVKVNNASNADIAPLSADFTFFGGLYRDVHLIVTDSVHMRMLDYGTSGLFVRQTNVSAAAANLQVTTEVWNDGGTPQNVTLNAVIVDGSNTTVQTLTATQSVAAHSGYTFVQTTTISNPHLWDGQRDPYLYHVYAQVQTGATVNDLVAEPLGLRSYAIDVNNGFFLNGHYLDLHGVNFHQDRINQGWAVTNAELDQDFNLAASMGSTALRMAHYQHAGRIYDDADGQGMVMWAEIPLVNGITNSANFTSNAEQQLTELIRQNYNHPSIIFWSISNEITNSGGPDSNTLLGDLNTVAKQQDPDRITTLADDSGPADATSKHTDTVGYNRYYGWYNGQATGLDGFLSSTHTNHPTMSFAISEYGAGGSIYQHQDNPPQTSPTSYFHPEEYQATLHEVSWQALASKPYVWGKFIWNMYDFASDGRNEGDTAGRNDKGLCTYDRVTCKDAFYWYKANWTTAPFVYLTDRRYTNRTTPTTDVKIYANTSSVTLTVNGVSQGARSSNNHIFLWTGVTLQAGSNAVSVSSTQGGTTYTDSATWNYSPNVRVNAGARLPYTDTSGKFYDVDHYYSGGTNGATSATIAGSPEQAEYQTYRSGSSFTYTIPAVNGSYIMYLKFMEPTKTGTGQRVFSVAANGATVISNLDIYAQVGKNTALQQQFPITVTNGIVTLSFTASTDSALVNAISLVHQ
ncbi:MAG: glycoside hydrolase family 2 protein [Ktedonobacterales bacterium]|nr:glycoside hydrolase family 2 protein [Ktedonobacterales bacterium]